MYIDTSMSTTTKLEAIPSAHLAHKYMLNLALLKLALNMKL